MQKIQHISYILILSLLFSCNPQKEKAKYIVNKWLKQRIILPDSINSKQDSLWKVMLDKKFKLLTIIDTSNCTTCRLRLYDWEKYIKDMDSTNSNIAFLFIVHAKDYNAIDLIKKKNKFTYPIFYDYKNKVGKLNTFPKDPRFQTFLLNAGSVNKLYVFPALQSSKSRAMEMPSFSLMRKSVSSDTPLTSAALFASIWLTKLTLRPIASANCSCVMPRILR